MEENKEYLTNQILTYMGNKRKLLPYIEQEIQEILKKLDTDKCVCADLFSGSGVVARMLKKYSSKLIVNDMEEYSKVVNQCYLTNKDSFDFDKYTKYYEKIMGSIDLTQTGIISKNYAPNDEDNITETDRVFYTIRNAKYIDSVRKTIDLVVDDPQYKPYFLAPLLYEASVHVNTSGVFKGFYKDKNTKIGKFGGTASNCLDRIKGNIELQKPIFSSYNCETEIYQQNTNELAESIKGMDIVYLDPPYNQHGYGSNYFMLNLICNYKMPEQISKVSGIPSDWNRSNYNKRQLALKELESLIKTLDSKYIIISYNSEGFISKTEMETMLNKYGKLEIREIKYNTFRASRNLKDRNTYVDEYLFILGKGIKSNG